MRGEGRRRDVELVDVAVEDPVRDEAVRSRARLERVELEMAALICEKASVSEVLEDERDRAGTHRP